MKKNLLVLSLLGGVAFAQDKPLDPCGSPNEVFSKYLLDQCYKGYFKAIMEAKKNAEEALRLAKEANNKVGDLENRVSSLEKTADDHERRIRDWKVESQRRLNQNLKVWVLTSGSWRK